MAPTTGVQETTGVLEGRFLSLTEYCLFYCKKADKMDTSFGITTSDSKTLTKGKPQTNQVGLKSFVRKDDVEAYSVLIKLCLIVHT